MLTIFSIFKEDIALSVIIEKSIIFLRLDYSTVQTNSLNNESFFFTQKYLGRAHYALLH